MSLQAHPIPISYFFFLCTVPQHCTLIKMLQKSMKNTQESTGRIRTNPFSFPKTKTIYPKSEIASKDDIEINILILNKLQPEPTPYLLIHRKIRCSLNC